MKRHDPLPPTWLVGRKTRLRALEPEDVPLFRRSRIVVDRQASGFIVQTLDGRDIGALAVLVSGPHAALAIGFVEDASYRDGCAADALRVICRGLPRALALQRIEALVDVSNRRSIDAYRSAGFEREGLLREVLLDGRTYRDAVMLSVLVDG